MPVEEIKKLQDERLVKQVKHVWDNVPYYRAKMEAKGVTPDDIKGIEDLHKLQDGEKQRIADILKIFVDNANKYDTIFSANVQFFSQEFAAILLSSTL